MCAMLIATKSNFGIHGVSVELFLELLLMSLAGLDPGRGPGGQPPPPTQKIILCLKGKGR